jgi:hypothetical protein
MDSHHRPHSQFLLQPRVEFLVRLLQQQHQLRDQGLTPRKVACVPLQPAQFAREVVLGAATVAFAI